MNIRRNSEKVWIGMALVYPHDGNNDLEGALGAVVNIMHVAKNRSDFENKVKYEMCQYGFDLKEIEDVELFDFNRDDYGDDLFILANVAKEQKRMKWGTFYTFDSEDD